VVAGAGFEPAAFRL